MSARAAEASPVYSYMRNPSMVDYPGHLAAVFFVSGCNFTCGFCHNAGLMGRKRKGISWDELKDVCQRFKSDWVDGVVVTGGEPTLDPRLIELIDFLRGFGFKVKLDTNGSRPAVLRECLAHIDSCAMDIKTTLEGYPELAGYSRVGDIEESIRTIVASEIAYELRTTVIDGVHTPAKIAGIAKLIEGARRYRLQPFVPRDNLPDPRFRELARTPPQLIEECARAAEPYVEEVLR